MLFLTTNFKASSHFKLNVFSILLGLFLVGCGGGGGGSNGLPSLESSFPVLDIPSAENVKVIVYDRISEADLEKIDEEIEDDSFIYNYNGDRYYKNNPIAGVDRAEAVYLGEGEKGHIVGINLRKNGEGEIDSALFAQVFPKINGREAITATVKILSTSVSSELSAYADDLIDDGFEYDDYDEYGNYGEIYYKERGELVYIFAHIFVGSEELVMWIVAKEDALEDIDIGDLF
jgi:hypothetical protein